MTEEQRQRLRSIKRFDQLIAFLRDELDWPIEQGYDEDDLTFDWSDDLGLKDSERVGIKEIKQLRPLETGQPWGIFFINFEKKQLPIVILRRILNSLVMKKRASANKAHQSAWQQHDLLFISAYGENSDRQITFAHFSEPAVEEDATKATLRVLGWDDEDTNLKLDHVADTLKQRLTWPVDTSDLDSWRKQWSAAFELRHHQVIDTAEELATHLATLAKRIRNRMLQVLPKESETGDLQILLKGFRTALIHDLNEAQFADMYAQTITYGLFSAAVSRTVPGAGTAVVQNNVVDMVPITNPFLREMLQAFLKAGGRKGKLDFDELGIQDVVDLLNDPQTRLDAVLRDFGNRTRGEDPVIHFYENFLKAYDKKLKIQRGVFYTPQPVVSYIVRSVHELLQTEFGLADGLADTTTWGEMLQKHPGMKLPPLTDEPGEKRTISPDEPFVQILDPATGTATFLVEIIDVIHRTLAAKWKQQRLTHAQQRAAWNDYVPRYLLPRLHAFELMMAPYAIAHMKIGLKLAETGYRFGTEERARIYLTNALEPWVKQPPLIGFDALAHEAAAVNKIKRDKRFTIVIGNPPYSNFGQLNKIPFILNLLDEYKKGLKERKLNLDDDFIKFVRYSQWQVLRSTSGVVGLITSNTYFDGLTHRRMRESLTENFDRLQILNLRGSIVKADAAPDGSVDDNVFDIKQGVGISLLTRLAAGGGNRIISYADIYGSRESKYARLLCGDVAIASISVTPPNFFFVRKNFSEQAAYDRFVSLRDAMPIGSSAIQTKRDALFVGFDRAEVAARMRDVIGNSSKRDIKQKYPIEPSAGWTPECLDTAHFSEANIRPYLYRPFDVRFIYYDDDLLGRSRIATFKHLLRENVALATLRQTVDDSFRHILCCNALCDINLIIGHHVSDQVFPLYLYPEGLESGAPRMPNFSQRFIRDLTARIGTVWTDNEGDLEASVGPLNVFHYIYALLHSPGYRSRYAEFLKIDFPRFPLTGTLGLFRALAGLGSELTALHLLESPRLAHPLTGFFEGRNSEVEKVSWSHDTVWLDKAKTAGFRGVKEEVWKFHIGGYQVCQKWLKVRKGRNLTDEDIAHYHRIVVALSETIRLMSEIDQVIDQHGGWPGAFQPQATT